MNVIGPSDKIISISAYQVESGNPNYRNTVYLAVCDDGTVWERTRYRETMERQSGKELWYYPGEEKYSDWRLLF